MMLSGQYTWEDRKDRIKVSIPLKGVALVKVDIRVTSLTLKINFNPYIVDIVLFDKVDSVKHKATVTEGILTVTLFKINPTKWSSLENDVMSDKVKASEIRMESSISDSNFQKTLDEKKKSRKIEDERLSVRKQMAVDEIERNQLESLKSEEKRQAEKEVYETFAFIEKEKDNGRGKISTSSSSPSSVFVANKNSLNQEIDDFLREDDIEDGLIFSDDSKSSIITSNRTEPLVLSESENISTSIDTDVKYIPPPRTAHDKSSGLKVDINFTPRVFPTPLRESKAAEEENWVIKNKKHLKNHGMLGQNIPKGNGKDAIEFDPIWLKAKGDDFFRSGDCRSAISAYSSAIDADVNMVAAYSNRAACHMKLGMYGECLLDCNTALGLLSKDFESNGSSQSSPPFDLLPTSVSKLDEKDKVMYLKLKLRRGITYCYLGDFQSSLQDYFQVLHQFTYEVSKNSSFTIVGVLKDQLLHDINQLQKLVDCDGLKKEGDKLFSDGNIDQAVIKYSDALNIFPIHVGCLSNRAASKMASNDYEGCIQDCTSALIILQANISDDFNRLLDYSNGINMTLAIIPAPGSEKRKQWTIKTITRRGMAYRQLHQYQEAITDYDQACCIDPNNEALHSDLENLKQLRIQIQQ